MKKQFSYTPKEGFMSYLWAFLAPVMVIVVPVVWPFGIRIGRMVILPYPYSAVVLIIIGICVLIYQFRRYKRENLLKRQGHPIVVDEDKITFTTVAKGQAKEVTFSISEVTRADFDKEDELLKVSTGKGNYTFDADFFENNTCFQEFMELFYQKGV